MKKCWDSDPSKRPSIKEILEFIGIWDMIYKIEFDEAEEKRVKLVKSKKL
ncbi:10693_t:CDS:1, partial [Funneliformis geosporum]